MCVYLEQHFFSLCHKCSVSALDLYCVQMIHKTFIVLLGGEGDVLYSKEIISPILLAMRVYKIFIWFINSNQFQ